MLRKASDWESVDDDFIQYDDNTPRLTTIDVWGTSNLPRFVSDDFKPGFVAPKTFILVVGRPEKKYVIWTSGCRYARYIQRIS